MRTTLLLILPLLVALAGGVAVLAWLSPDESALTPDRLAAAEFLGVAPAALEPSSGEPLPYTPRDNRMIVWQCETPGALGPGPVIIGVDVDLLQVVHLRWDPDSPRWGRPGPAEGPGDRERALRAARDFLDRHCPLWSEASRLVRAEFRLHPQHPLYELQWEGPGPEEFVHRVTLEVPLATYQVAQYTVLLTPPAPPASVPVLLTAEQAEERVLQAASTLWPDMAPPITARAYLLWTTSPFAPAGQPVHMVDVIGSLKQPTLPGREPLQKRICVGVDAHSGEIYERFSPQRYRSAEPVAPRLTAQEALARAQTALPPALERPRLTVEGPTPDCPVAPPGVLAYAIRVEGVLVAPEEGDVRRRPWAQTWAVDAVSGRLWGLGDHTPAPGA